jgi:hypothetical protein
MGVVSSTYGVENRYVHGCGKEKRKRSYLKDTGLDAKTVLELI